MTPEALIEVLEAVRGAGDDARVAFDADGTLWRGDVGNDMFEAALAMRWFHPSVANYLESTLRENGVTPRGGATVNALAEQLYTAHREGRVADGPTYTAMACAFAGRSSREVETFTRGALGAAKLDCRIFTDVARIVEWARVAKVEVVVVSASPREAVIAGVELLGIRPEEVIAQTLEQTNGLLMPALDGPAVFGDGKVAHLVARKPNARLIAAFGDSRHDIPMMRLADIGVGVAPSQGLKEASASLPRYHALEGTVRSDTDIGT